MKTLKRNGCYYFDNSDSVFFDVDDTLVIWDHTDENGGHHKNAIAFSDPNIGNHTVYLLPHKTHINTLIRNHGRGKHIIVWSAAGARWALEVVEKLGLQQYITLIMEKPVCYVDDSPMENWKPKRIYIPHDVEGK
jgi:hypothetical protein